MQGWGSRCSSRSTIDDLELHRSSTPETSRASFPSTLVELTSSACSAPSVSYEPPANDPVRPWWEAEAEKILRGPSLQAIRLLCRYRVYRDDSTPGSILQRRWPSSLNSFLVNLSAGTYNWGDVADLCLEQKVMEILKRLVSSIPVANVWRDLASPTLLLEENASHLASKLNEESLSRLQNITFTDFVRRALYPEESIEPILDFEDWHDSLFNLVCNNVERSLLEAWKYVQIEQVSKAASKFVLLLTNAVVTRREPRALGGLRSSAAVSSPVSGFTPARPGVHLPPSPRRSWRSAQGPR